MAAAARRVHSIKHSAATRIEITLAFRADEIELVVQDNGCGLEVVPKDPEGAHFGLLGIRERVDKIGGVLQINGERGVGTRLSVMVPSRHQRASDAAAPALDESWRTS
jgi:signal transduction histidine kinase